jgi:two-component system, NarL family, nitrate/nitrite response regulator NarL
LLRLAASCAGHDGLAAPQPRGRPHCNTYNLSYLSAWGAVQMTNRSDGKTRSTKTLYPVAIVGKSPIVRAGLAQILQIGGFRVVAAGSCLEDIPETLFLCQTNPLILTNLDDGAITLLTQIRALKGRHDSARIAVLCESLRACELLSILDAGANCILLSNEIYPETLIKSLEIALMGGVILPLSIVNDLKDWLQSSKASLALTPEPHITSVYRAAAYSLRAADGHQLLDRTTQNESSIHLSVREKTILRHLMQGASNKLIARELDVAEATIKVHVRAVLRKIRASNRTQAAMWAHKYLYPVAESCIPDSGAVKADESSLGRV